MTVLRRQLLSLVADGELPPDGRLPTVRARSRASLVVSTNEHGTILDAIAARTPDVARTAMRDHLQTRFAALRAEHLDAAR